MSGSMGRIAPDFTAQALHMMGLNMRELKAGMRTVYFTVVIALYLIISGGFWHARSNAFWESPTIQFLGQIRMIPDTLLIIGSGALLLFVLNAVTKLKPVEIKDGENFT